MGKLSKLPSRLALSHAPNESARCVFNWRGGGVYACGISLSTKFCKFGKLFLFSQGLYKPTCETLVFFLFVQFFSKSASRSPILLPAPFLWVHRSPPCPYSPWSSRHESILLSFPSRFPYGRTFLGSHSLRLRAYLAIDNTLISKLNLRFRSVNFKKRDKFHFSKFNTCLQVLSFSAFQLLVVPHGSIQLGICL